MSFFYLENYLYLLLVVLALLTTKTLKKMNIARVPH